jgi:hypothetical protein
VIQRMEDVLNPKHLRMARMKFHLNLLKAFSMLILGAMRLLFFFFFLVCVVVHGVEYSWTMIELSWIDVVVGLKGFEVLDYPTRETRL